MFAMNGYGNGQTLQYQKNGEDTVDWEDCSELQSVN